MTRPVYYPSDAPASLNFPTSHPGSAQCPKFPQFPRLPLELQDMIWTLLLPHRIHTPNATHPPPAVAQACERSQKIALKTGLMIRFAPTVVSSSDRIKSHPPSYKYTWFDSSRDALLIDARSLCNWGPCGLALPNLSVERSLRQNTLNSEIAPQPEALITRAETVIVVGVGFPKEGLYSNTDSPDQIESLADRKRWPVLKQVCVVVDDLRVRSVDGEQGVAGTKKEMMSRRNIEDAIVAGPSEVKGLLQFFDEGIHARVSGAVFTRQVALFLGIDKERDLHLTCRKRLEHFCRTTSMTTREWLKMKEPDMYVASNHFSSRLPHEHNLEADERNGNAILDTAQSDASWAQFKAAVQMLWFWLGRYSVTGLMVRSGPRHLTTFREIGWEQDFDFRHPWVLKALEEANEGGLCIEPVALLRRG